MSKSTRTLVALFFWLPLSSTGTATAAPFAYVAGDLAITGPSSIVQTDTLFHVDLATGEGVVIGQVQSADCSLGVCNILGGISVDPIAGTLYAVSDDDDLLITIDTGTGQATVIDTLTLEGSPITSISKFGLTHDASGTLYFAASSNRRLSVLDPATAFLSDFATGGTAPDTNAIADASATHLWALRWIGGGAHDLISVQKVAPGAPLPVDFITSIGTVSPALTSSNSIGLDLAPDETLWGVQRGPSIGGGDVFQIDTSTAALTSIAELTVPATSEVIVNPRSLSIIVPEPAQLLMQLTAVLGIAALEALRRKRTRC